MQPYPTIQNYGYTPYGSYPQQPIMPMQDRLSQLTQNYQNSVPQYQMAQPQPQISYGLNGEIVDSIDVVKAKNVDMSGSVVYYPQSSGECIFTKQLQADGTSRILTYRVEREVKKQDTVQQKVDIDVISNMFGQLKEDLLSEIAGIKDMIPTLMSGTCESPKSTRGGSQK